MDRKKVPVFGFVGGALSFLTVGIALWVMGYIYKEEILMWQGIGFSAAGIIEFAILAVMLKRAKSTKTHA